MSEVAYTAVTGRLARALQDYPPLVPTALLTAAKDALEQLVAEAPSPSEPEDEMLLTGDPIADEWERAVARGETPNFEAT